MFKDLEYIFSIRNSLAHKKTGFHTADSQEDITKILENAAKPNIILTFYIFNNGKKEYIQLGSKEYVKLLRQIYDTKQTLELIYLHTLKIRNHLE